MQKKNVFRIAISLLAGGFLPLSGGGQPLGVLTEDLHARDAYAGQSRYMDFYHALALSRDSVDISFAAPLSIRGTLPAGPVYEEDIKKLYPFPNTLVVLRMRGQEIKDYMEGSYDGWICTVADAADPVLRLTSRTDRNGQVKWNFATSPAHFDSAGGLDYTVDITRPCGERVCIRSLSNGAPFDTSAVYRVAMTHFRAAGAGGLLGKAGIDPKHIEDRIVERGTAFRDILREFLSARTVLDPASWQTGSWKFIPEDTAVPGIERDLDLIFGPAPPTRNSVSPAQAAIQ